MDTEVWREERLLIDGKLVDAQGGTTYDNVNPANEEVIGVAADGSEADMERAIAAARRAFDDDDWSTDVELRVRCLRQLHTRSSTTATSSPTTIVAEVGAPGRC